MEPKILDHFQRIRRNERNMKSYLANGSESESKSEIESVGGSGSEGEGWKGRRHDLAKVAPISWALDRGTE